MVIGRKRNILVFLIIIVVLSFCFVGCGKKDNEAKKEEKLVKVEEDDSIISLTEYFGLYDYCDGSGFGYRLDKTNRSIEDFTDEEKLNILLDILISRTLDNEVDSIEIEEDELEKYFDDLSFLDIVKEKGSYGRAGFSITYKNGKYITKLNSSDCGDEFNETEELFFYEAEKNSHTLYITYAYAYATYELLDTFAVEDEYEIMLYKHKGDKDAVYAFTEAPDKLDFSSFDKYQYVIDISNGKYKLKEIKYIEGE